MKNAITAKIIHSFKDSHRHFPTFKKIRKPAVIIVNVLLSLYTTAIAAPTQQASADDWQRDIEKQLQKQLKQKQSIEINSVVSPKRMEQLVSKAQQMATTENFFKRNQIGRYCQKEIRAFCSDTANNTDLFQCLVNNTNSLSKPCKAVASDNHISKPTLTNTTHHDVLIPAGSRYRYLPHDRSLAVTLSKPSHYKGVPISGVVSWYDGGNIRSFKPYNTPVRYGYLTFVGNETLHFFPSGKVQQGTLYDPIQVGKQFFKHGDTIARDDEKGTWFKVYNIE